MAALAIAWLLHVPEITAWSSARTRRATRARGEALDVTLDTRGTGRSERCSRERCSCSRGDVRELLDMESCIAAMEDVLAALARDELSLPLRSIFVPPGEALMGLMPAYRGGTDPVFALKEIVVAPANSGRGLDPHQGTVLLHDGVTGVLRAILNASAVTEIRTAAVFRSGDEAPRASRCPARGGPRRRRAGGARTPRRCAP
jgi:hypothetical protein